MIVGVDVSSKRIDLSWLEDGKPQRWHQELAKGHLIDRLRSIRVQWPSTNPTTPGHGVSDVAIEMPFGRSRASVAALMAVVGIVTKQAPPWARVAWPSAGELRAAIGARNTKASAHERIRNSYFICVHEPHCLLSGWNEHELDALVACMGWSAILKAQDAA